MEEQRTTFRYRANAPCVFCRGEPNTTISFSRDAKGGGLETVSNLPCCAVCRRRRDKLDQMQLGIGIGGAVLCALLPLLPGDQLPANLLGGAVILLFLAGSGFLLGFVALMPVQWLLFSRKLDRWLRDYAEPR